MAHRAFTALKPPVNSWPKSQPEAAGLDTAAVTRAVEIAQTTNSAQLVILVNGLLIVDEVFNKQPVDVYAVQKGIVSVLIGMAQSRGWLQLNDPVEQYLPVGWTRLPPAEESKLTLRHLVTMTTGMDDNLNASGTVGISWRYNNTAYNYLKRILTEHEHLSLADLTTRDLTDPLEMHATHWVDRPAILPDGRPLTGLLSTAADLARVGEFVRCGGVADDLHRVAEGYIDALAQPGSVENPAWGLMWWNNRSTTFRIPMREEKIHNGPIIPQAPNDLIAARGALENHLAIIPSRKMVVARTVQPPAANKHPARFERAFYSALFGKQ